MTVTTASDAPVHSGTSLRDALAQANLDAAAGTSDVLLFAASLAGSTITLTQGQLELSGAGAGTITIDGSGLSSPLTLSGNNVSSVIQVDSGVHALLNDLVLTAGTYIGITPGRGGDVGNRGTLTVTGCTISNSIHGGGIHNIGTLMVSNCTVSGNSDSGILDDGGGQAMVSNSTISGNSANVGGGLSGVFALVINCLISGNSAQTNGGGAAMGPGTMVNCTITGNTANTGGGVATNGSTGGLMILNCTITNNRAADTTSHIAKGGGLYNEGTISTVINSTIANNTASVANTGEADGGGIYNGASGSLALSGDTIAGNSATGGNSAAGSSSNGGGIANPGMLTMADTILAGNSAPTGPDLNVSGSGKATGNNNVIGISNPGLPGVFMSNGVAGNQIGTTANPLNAKLGPLQNNGGPTATMALLPGSPALGAGGGITTMAQDAGPTDQTLSVSNAAAVANTPGQFFLVVGGEEMAVTAVNATSNPNTLTVTRGINGVTASPKQNDPLFLFTDQRDLVRSSAPDVGAYQANASVPGVPVVSGLSPASGSLTGGISVAVTGTNLAGTTAVYFGLLPATIVNASPTQIVAVSPAAALGAVDVTVVTGGGTSALVAADRFTYVPQVMPTVTVTDAGGTYNGNPFPASGSATGVGGAAVKGTFAFTYFTGSTTQGSGSATAPTNPGTYTVVASFTSGDPNYTNASSSPVTFTIAPQLPVLQFSAATYSTAESAGTVTITVLRTANTSGTVSVNYATHDGSAVAGTNYTAASGTLTFGPGVSSATFTVGLRDDGLVNGNQTVQLTLSNASGATLGSPASITLTITESDLPGVPNSPPPAPLLTAARAFSHSLEHYTQFVTNAYAQFLKRVPDAPGLAAWVSGMQAGLYSDEQVEALFLGSVEYIANHGGTGQAWIIGMYQDLLGRTPSNAEVSNWLSVLAAGTPTTAVALGFTASPEREAERVRTNYQTYLGRAPSADEVTLWVNGFLGGLSNEDMVGGFVGSPEYYLSGRKGNDNAADWVAQAYLDVLFRAAATSEVNLWLQFLGS
jgi:hypothetical protein